MFAQLRIWVRVGVVLFAVFALVACSGGGGGSGGEGSGSEVGSGSGPGAPPEEPQPPGDTQSPDEPVILTDDFGPPPPGHPSAFTGPLIGLQFAGDVLSTLPPANQGAFAGGATGTSLDAEINNAVPEGQQRVLNPDPLLVPPGIFNIPTNSKPSPLFGAEPFVQKMLNFRTVIIPFPCSSTCRPRTQPIINEMVQIMPVPHVGIVPSELHSGGRN